MSRPQYLMVPFHDSQFAAFSKKGDREPSPLLYTMISDLILDPSAAEIDAQKALDEFASWKIPCEGITEENILTSQYWQLNITSLLSIARSPTIINALKP